MTCGDSFHQIVWVRLGPNSVKAAIELITLISIATKRPIEGNWHFI